MTARTDAEPYYRKAAILLVLFLLIGLVGVHFGDRSSVDDSSPGVAQSAVPAGPAQPSDSSLLHGYSPDATLNVMRHSPAARVVNRQGSADWSTATMDPRSARHLRRSASVDGWVGLIP